jgi:hypothetical protein
MYHFKFSKDSIIKIRNILLLNSENIINVYKLFDFEDEYNNIFHQLIGIYNLSRKDSLEEQINKGLKNKLQNLISHIEKCSVILKDLPDEISTQLSNDIDFKNLKTIIEKNKL